MISPGDVRTFKQGEGNAVVVGLGIWAVRQGKWIQIHITGPSQSHTTVTNNPESERYHRTLFRNLRQTLVQQKAWPYGEEGSEVEQQDEYIRLQPIHAKGGESASAILLRDRGRY